MWEAQSQESDVYAYDESLPPVMHKRKRLREDHLVPNEYAVRMLAWKFVGTIGIILAMGSTFGAIVTGNGGFLVPPVIYMLAVMALMRT